MRSENKTDWHEVAKGLWAVSLQRFLANSNKKSRDGKAARIRCLTELCIHGASNTDLDHAISVLERGLGCAPNVPLERKFTELGVSL